MSELHSSISSHLAIDTNIPRLSNSVSELQSSLKRHRSVGNYTMRFTKLDFMIRVPTKLQDLRHDNATEIYSFSISSFGLFQFIQPSRLENGLLEDSLTLDLLPDWLNQIYAPEERSD